MARLTRIALLVLLVAFLAGSAQAISFRLVLTAGPGGTTYPAPGSYNWSWNSSHTIWALPNEGYKFTGWTQGGVQGPANLNPMVYVVPFSNKSLTANFAPLPALSPTTALKHFMAKVDGYYSCNTYQTSNELGYTTYFMNMNSQKWRSAAEVDHYIWNHFLIVTKGWFTGDTSVLLISGGHWYDTPPTEVDDTIGYMSLLAGFPVAEIKTCPNQGLYFTDDPIYRSEDDILAYSFDKYLVTGDYTWNGHLPMAKAALYAMDTVQRRISGVTKFIVAGASKRGWATWLTAAADDPRVIGFVPIVIPILNISDQMKHHWESYGFWAPAVTPYVNYDLFCRIYSPEGDNWRQIEDPYTYFGRSTTIQNKPKLIVNASGDQFFTTDSMRYFWNQIPGPGAKHARVMPNASHGMEEGDSFDQVLATAVAWGKNVKDGVANPAYTWVVNPDRSITTTFGGAPTITLWQATNPNARDFRVESIGTVWTATNVSYSGNTATGYCPPPAQGWTAYFLELNWGSDHIYTTEVVVNPDTLPFEGTECLP